MKILLAFILFMVASFYLAIIISIGVCAGLKMWENKKNEDNKNN